MMFKKTPTCGWAPPDPPVPLDTDLFCPPLRRHCVTAQIEHAQFVSTFFSFDIVAENGNNVKATFDIVERIVQLVAFDNVAQTLLLVRTGLKTVKVIL